ncbi:MAG TPA: hypothetical protein QF487_04985, partial [Acidimicrobiales bacterium]|nr:hypothetical protein [Acidimicrobiales bacterium]
MKTPSKLCESKIRLVLFVSLLGLVSCANYDGRSMEGQNPTDTLDVLVEVNTEIKNQDDTFSKFSKTQ